jgi:hypothetical protein
MSNEEDHEEVDPGSRPSTVDTFYYDPASYAANQEPAFSAAEKEAVSHAARVTNDDHTQLFPNFEMPSRHSEAACSSAAKGYTSLYSKAMLVADFIEGSGDDARIRFSSRWEGIVSVLAVPPSAIPEGMTEQHMLACVKNLLSKVAMAPSAYLEKLEPHISHIFGEVCGSAKDSCHWEAYLTGHGHLLGVYKKKGILVGESDSYYLVAHSDSSVMGDALCQFALGHPGMTLGEFVASPQMARVKEFSRRLNARLMARLVNALGFDRSKFHMVDDVCSYVDPEADEAYPDKVRGLCCKTVYNTFYDPLPSGDSLVYYNHTSRLGLGDHKYVAQLLGPQKGILLCETVKGRDYRTSCTEVMKEGGAPAKTYHTNHFSSWPVGVGRSRNGPVKIKSTTLVKMQTSHVSAADQADRLLSYRVPDEDDYKRNRFILGLEHTPDQELFLSPVAVIVPPRKE